MPLCSEHKRLLHTGISQPINTFHITTKQQKCQFRCMAFKSVLAHVLTKCFTNVRGHFRETIIQERELYAFISADEYLLILTI